MRMMWDFAQICTVGVLGLLLTGGEAVPDDRQCRTGWLPSGHERTSWPKQAIFFSELIFQRNNTSIGESTTAWRINRGCLSASLAFSLAQCERIPSIPTTLRRSSCLILDHIRTARGRRVVKGTPDDPIEARFGSVGGRTSELTLLEEVRF